MITGFPRLPVMAPPAIRTAVATVQAKFDARFTATPTFQNANLPVQMKGVADFIHGQTGVAPMALSPSTSRYQYISQHDRSQLER
jgi:hypothetical protein